MARTGLSYEYRARTVARVMNIGSSLWLEV